MSNNGESDKSDSSGQTEEVKITNYPTTSSTPDKDFESPYSIYMSQPTGGQNQYGAGAGSYGNQNYSFNAPQEQYQPQQYQEQYQPQQQYLQQEQFQPQQQYVQQGMFTLSIAFKFHKLLMNTLKFLSIDYQNQHQQPQQMVFSQPPVQEMSPPVQQQVQQMQNQPVQQIQTQPENNAPLQQPNL
jgi:hypothetical protein